MIYNDETYFALINGIELFNLARARKKRKTRREYTRQKRRLPRRSKIRDDESDLRARIFSRLA